MIKKWKNEMQRPVLVYRPARPVGRIIEGIEREKRNFVAGQAAIILKLRRYMR